MSFDENGARRRLADARELTVPLRIHPLFADLDAALAEIGLLRVALRAAERARHVELGKRMRNASESRRAERAEADELFEQAIAQRDEALSRIEGMERACRAILGCSDGAERAREIIQANVPDLKP
jgi:hypothetical protein